jgi:hypothetical protein
MVSLRRFMFELVRSPALRSLAILLATACAPEGGGDGVGAAPPRDAGDVAAPPADSQNPPVTAGPLEQTPPEGRAALDAWLAAGHYRSWACEPTIQNARPGGAHGRNRICSNALASGHGQGPYPVGAAAVKELYGAGDQPVGHAVAHKRTAGTRGSDWYWYERTGSTIYADGVGTPLCTGCHSLAQQRGGNDFVYLQIR